MSLPSCPSCGARLFPHEMSNGECGSCGRPLPESVAAEPRAEDQRPAYSASDEPDVRAWPRGLFERPDATAYRMVRLGVNLIRWGAGLSLLVETAADGFQLAASYLPRGSGLLQIEGMLFIGQALARLVLVLTVFLGLCFCCAVPGKSRGEGWARGLIACLVLTLFLAVVGLAISVSVGVGGARSEQFEVVLLAMIPFGLALLAGYACFYILLRGVARDFGDHRLGNGFLAFFLTSIIVPAIIFTGLVALGFALADQKCLGGGWRLDAFMFTLIGAVALVLTVALAVWLVVLLSRLHRLLSEEYDPRSRWLDDERDRRED
jgi:hypothetical protein